MVNRKRELPTTRFRRQAWPGLTHDLQSDFRWLGFVAGGADARMVQVVTACFLYARPARHISRTVPQDPKAGYRVLLSPQYW